MMTFLGKVVVNSFSVGAILAVVKMQSDKKANWTTLRAQLRNADNVEAQRRLVDFYQTHGVDTNLSQAEVVEKLKDSLKGAKISVDVDKARAQLLFAYEELQTVVEKKLVRPEDVYRSDFPSSKQVKNFMRLVMPIEEYNALAPGNPGGAFKAKGEWTPPNTLLWLKGVYLPTRELPQHKKHREQQKESLKALAAKNGVGLP